STRHAPLSIPLPSATLRGYAVYCFPIRRCLAQAPDAKLEMDDLFPTSRASDSNLARVSHPLFARQTSRRSCRFRQSGVELVVAFQYLAELTTQIFPGRNFVEYA